MYYSVVITLTVKAKTVEEAFDLGTAAAEHVIDTFNDNKSISPYVAVEAKEESSGH